MRYVNAPVDNTLFKEAKYFGVQKLRLKFCLKTNAQFLIQKMTDSRVCIVIQAIIKERCILGFNNPATNDDMVTND